MVVAVLWWVVVVGGPLAMGVQGVSGGAEDGSGQVSQVSVAQAVLTQYLDFRRLEVGGFQLAR